MQLSNDSTILVTGGAGFIGSALVRHLVRETDSTVVNVDRLTYAGSLLSLEPVADDPRYHFEKVDICELEEVRRIVSEYQPTWVVHLAAESHVDRSIDGSDPFIHTNIIGTYTLLKVLTEYWDGLCESARRRFRFLHLSTDEVYGSLGDTGYFTEESRYAPRSPYSASKASADHLARAWSHTYGVPVIVTNCSNNYGPYQYPEKLIPLTILNAVEGKPIRVYGAGENVRDWLYVEDHVRAILRILDAGRVGETYNIGARSEKKNLAVVRAISELLDELVQDPVVARHASLIEHVSDRPGHDWRYAINPTKLETELGWKAHQSFQTGLQRTVSWYLDNLSWCEQVTNDRYDRTRLGLRSRAQ